MDLENNISNNNIEIEFSNFKGLREQDYDILRETFNKIDKTNVNFNLVELNKKIEPLELLIKLTSNKITGTMIINITNNDKEVIGKIKFHNVQFLSIDGLIDFSFIDDPIDKNIIVHYECNDKFYIGKNGKEEKLV
jgi:hypothetical protein